MGYKRLGKPSVSFCLLSPGKSDSGGVKAGRGSYGGVLGAPRVDTVRDRRSGDTCLRWRKRGLMLASHRRAGWILRVRGLANPRGRRASKPTPSSSCATSRGTHLSACLGPSGLADGGLPVRKPNGPRARWGELLTPCLWPVCAVRSAVSLRPILIFSGFFEPREVPRRAEVQDWLLTYSLWTLANFTAFLGLGFPI